MEWLNYHHLYYFWMSAREGSIAKASAKLCVSQPTISAQVRALEDGLGERLFERAGRRLELTEAGRLVVRYADEIFLLGKEMRDTLKGRPSSRLPALTVGISDVMPKMVAHRLLSPILQGGDGLRLVCREEKTEALFADLASQRLDALLTDAPLPPGAKVKAFSHLLGRCGIVCFGREPAASRYRKGFPASLDGAPLLLPTENTLLRRDLDRWFDALSVRPSVVGEFDDSALLKVFGQAGAGLFLAPAYVEKEIRAQYRVAVVGRTEDVTESFYLISPERRVKNPAVARLLETARRGFA